MVKNKLQVLREDILPVRKYRKSGESARWRELKNKYAGQRCFILGNGPSLKRQDLTLLKDEVTFVTNWFVLHEKYEQIDPNFYCICGEQVFGVKPEQIFGPKADTHGWGKSVRFNPQLYKLLREKARDAIKVFPFIFKKGLETQNLFQGDEIRYLLYQPPFKAIHYIGRINLEIDSQRLYTGDTVIINFCLPIAFYLGFKDIYLLGCDCDYGIKKPDDKRKYFYNSNGHTSDAPPFEWLQNSWAPNGTMMQSFAIIKKEFQAHGRTIYNATAGGKLKVFPRVKYEDVIGCKLFRNSS